MSERDDDLLTVISSSRRMSWQNVTHAIDTLRARAAGVARASASAPSSGRWESLRLLDWLAHCDVLPSGESPYVHIAPPVLARLPVTGLPTAVLCGARSPKTLPSFAAACSRHNCALSIARQGPVGQASLVPRSVFVEADSEEHLAALSAEMRVTCPPTPPAWGLLRFCGSLAEYLASLALTAAPDLDWPRRDYDSTCLRFCQPHSPSAAFRLSAYEDRVRAMRRHLLWEGGAYRVVDRDWGRYAILARLSISVLVYDRRRFVLAVPEGAPLPRLFARACALCSGRAPTILCRADVSDHTPELSRFVAFGGVPPVVASAIADKLNQRLQLASLTISALE